jgi:hypothetical protein
LIVRKQRRVEAWQKLKRVGNSDEMGRRKKKEKGKDEGGRANLEGQRSRVTRIGKQRRAWVLKGHLWIAEVGKELPRLVRERQ